MIDLVPSSEWGLVSLLQQAQADNVLTRDGTNWLAVLNTGDQQTNLTFKLMFRPAGDGRIPDPSSYRFNLTRLQLGLDQ
jgi:hypothetical protein